MKGCYGDGAEVAVSKDGETEILPHPLAIQELGALVFVVVVGLIGVLSCFKCCSLFVIHGESLLEPAECALLLLERLAAH